MKYQEINFPVEFHGDDFIGNHINRFDKPTARNYFKWYISIKNERILILEQAVNSTQGFEAWNADLSIESLKKLQMWFDKVVEKRAVTDEEKKRHMSQFTEKWQKVIEPLEWVVTDKTRSICHDVGIYFAEILIKNNPHLSWGQNLTAKTFVYLNEPCVIAEGFSFSPYNIAHVCALKSLEGKNNNWEELYEYWDKWAKGTVKEDLKN